MKSVPQIYFCISDTRKSLPISSGIGVSAMDFRSGGWWFEPSLCHGVVSLDKKLYSTLSVFTQVYKWVPAIIMLGGNLAMD